MRSRLFALATRASLFPLAFILVSLALATVGLADDPCPGPGSGGC